jgi:hypothetical protein
VKGLRVLFESKHLQKQQHQQQEEEEEQQQQQRLTASICAWLRRHAHQVVALAIIGAEAAVVLAALAEVASSRSSSSGSGGGAAAAAAQAPAAAGGGSGTPTSAAAAAAGGADRECKRRLPLRRLVVWAGNLLEQQVCENVLVPLLGALPYLQHLHLPLLGGNSFRNREEAGAAAVAALAPLQHSTSLTSLVLVGPAQALPAARQQLLQALPPTLRHLGWNLDVYRSEAQPTFDCLTGLTSLRLTQGAMTHRFLREGCFIALTGLRRLVLEGALISDAGLLACKEQLVSLHSRHFVEEVLPHLTRLESLSVTAAGTAHETRQLLQQAPPLRALHVQLHAPLLESFQLEEVQDRPQEQPTADSRDSPWVLQQYRWLTGLKQLGLELEWPLAAPKELCCLTQLQQLTLNALQVHPLTAASWAQALAGLVHLEVLSMPAVLTALEGPWLTGLTRLVVLQVGPAAGDSGWFGMNAAAAHITQFLVPGSAGVSTKTATAASSSGGSSSSSSSSSGSEANGDWLPQDFRMVCFSGLGSIIGTPVAELYHSVVAAVPVPPPQVHMYRGSLGQLQQCGVELWPAPVAARLQQLHLGCFT